MLMRRLLSRRTALWSRCTMLGGVAALGLLLVAGSTDAQNPTGTPTGTGVTPNDPVPICRSIPNGSFECGFRGWNLERCEGGFGRYETSTGASIQDLSSIPGWDDDAACLSTYASAEWTCKKPSGSAGQAQISLVTKTEVTGRYLRFKVGGGFFFTLFDRGHVSYAAQVVVTNGAGAMVKCPIVRGDFRADMECEQGLIADGYIPFETVCCDLFDTSSLSAEPGIRIGDIVKIEVVFSAAAYATDDCDFANFGGVLYVDKFQFCRACLTPWPHDGPLYTTAPAAADAADRPVDLDALGESVIQRARDE